MLLVFLDIVTFGFEPGNVGNSINRLMMEYLIIINHTNLHFTMFHCYFAHRISSTYDIFYSPKNSFTVEYVVWIIKCNAARYNYCCNVSVRAGRPLHPGEGRPEGRPGVGGAEAVQLPDGLLQLVPVQHVIEPRPVARPRPRPRPGGGRGLGGLSEALLGRVFGLRRHAPKPAASLLWL